MSKYVVYKHTFPNNKVYIGITSQKNPEVRWGKHGGGYKNHYPIWYAIQKYGWENIIHEIVYDNLSEDEAKQKEIELIALYNSTNHEFGYNVSPGGDSVSELTKIKLSKIHRGHSVSEDTKHKIGVANSKALKGRKLSNETKEKIRQGHLGKKYKPMSEKGKENIRQAQLGKKLSEEHKQKISKSNKGKIISEEQRLASSIRMKEHNCMSNPEVVEKMKQSLKRTQKERTAKRLATMKERYPDGLKQTEESNRKRSDALKGKPKSEETKQKMRKPKSPETVEKMRLAQKRSHEARKLGITYQEYLKQLDGQE